MATFSVSGSDRVTQILASLVTHGLSEEEQKRFFDVLTERKGDLDVTISINGFDVDAKYFFGHLETTYDEHVQRSAHKILDGQMWDLKEHMTKAMEEFMGTKFMKGDEDDS